MSHVPGPCWDRYDLFSQYTGIKVRLGLMYLDPAGTGMNCLSQYIKVRLGFMYLDPAGTGMTYLFKYIKGTLT